MTTAPNCNCSGCYGGPELFHHGAPAMRTTEFLNLSERQEEERFQARVAEAVTESKRRAAAIKVAKLAK